MIKEFNIKNKLCELHTFVSPVRKMALSFFTCYLLLFTCNLLHAQTPAQEIETLLSARAITYAQASRFALQASDKLITQDPNEAFHFAVSNGWLPENVQADQNAKLSQISKLLVNCFDIKGGLFYSMSKSGHHAYRELQYINVIHGKTYPNQTVSGDMFLFMINRLLREQ